MTNDEAFPRGKPSSSGHRRPKTVKPIKRKAVDKIDDLFKPQGKNPDSKDKKSKKDSHLNKHEAAEAKQKNGEVPEAVSLSSKVDVKVNMLQPSELTPGFVVLGSIAEIFDYRMVISLPGNIRGSVNISDVCDGYSNALKSYADGGAGEAPPMLQNIFSVGQLIACKVTERPVKEVPLRERVNKKSGKSKKSKQDTPIVSKEFLYMTVNPRALNAELSESSLVVGMVMNGAIASVEEKGFVVDLGLSRKAFIKSSDASDFEQQSPDNRLSLHRVLPFVVSEVKPGFIGLKLNSTLNKTDFENLPLRCVFPGLVLSLDVLDVQRYGLVLQRSSGDSSNPLLATAHWRHLPSPVDSYKIGKVVSATVLYVDPLTKNLAVSLSRHLRRVNILADSNVSPVNAIGTFFEKAKVLRQDGKRAVVFDVSEDAGDGETKLYTRAYAKLNNLADERATEIDQTKFVIGSTHRCRVTGLSLLDGCYMVSLQKSVLDNKFQSYASIIGGTKVTATVDAAVGEGMRVSLDQSKIISGFIPWTHASDANHKGSTEILEKRFPVGTKLKCRVLRVDNSRKCVFLTAKKQLVKSKFGEDSLFNDLASIVPETSCCDGYVMQIKTHGMVVGFYGNVVGFLPKSLLPQYCRSVGDLTTLFHNGQVIPCRAKKVNVETNTLIVAMISPDDEKQQQNEELSQLKDSSEPSPTKQKKPSPVHLGQVLACKILSKREAAFQVLLRLPGDDDFSVLATLPSIHLSDFPENQALLAKAFDKQPGSGHIIDQVVVVSVQPRVIVSRKTSLVEVASASRFAKSIEDIQPSEILHGWVVSVSDIGVFVALPGNVVGFAPRKYLADRFVLNPTQLFKYGQSVVVKVVEFNAEKDENGRRRCIVSLCLRDVRPKSAPQSEFLVDDGMRLLESFLKERQQACDLLGTSSSVNKLVALNPLGSAVSATVTEVLAEEVTLKVEVDGEQFVAKIQHDQMAPSFRQPSSAQQNPTVGSRLDVVVLFHDLENVCLQVTANTRIVSDVKTKLESPALPVIPGQTVSSEVQAIRAGFCTVVSLRDHATGRFALVPARRHINDAVEALQFIQGQTNAVVIKVSNGPLGLPTAIFKSHERRFNKEQNKAGSGEIDAKSPLLPSGTIVSGEIVNTSPTVLNLKLEDGKFRGRVHITETSGDHVAGFQPFSGILKGQKVKARVLGLHHRTHHKATTRAKLFECSLILDKPTHRKHPILSEVDVCEGRHVPVFVKEYRNEYALVEFSRLVMRPARLNLLNVSEDTSVVDEVTTRYPLGSCLGEALVIRTSPYVEFSLVGRPTPIEPGRVYPGLVSAKSNSAGIQISFADSTAGNVALTDIADEFSNLPIKSVPLKKVVSCFVSKRLGDGTWECSLRQSRVVKGELGTSSSSSIVDKELDTAADLVIGDVVRGFVVACKEHSGVFIRLGRNVVGRAAFERSSEFYLVNPEKFFVPGLLVSAKVISVDYRDVSRHVELSLLSSDTGVTLDIPKSVTRGKRKDLSNQEQRRKRTRTSSTSSVQSAESAVSSASSSSPAKKAALKSLVDSIEAATATAASMDSTPGFDFSQSEIVQPPLAVGGQQDEEEDDEMEVSGDKKTAKKETAREREYRTYAMEMARLRGADDPDGAEPKSSDDFDRLAIEKPNSSLVWSRYIAFHLSNLDVSKAREVAERALKSTSFREETERLNVWVAYFNLENMFGSDDSLRDVVRRACQEADPLAVTERLVDVYIRAEKFEAAEHQLSLMTKKFRENPIVWLRQGEFFYNRGKLDAARAVLNKALDALEMRHHVDLIVKFAMWEMSSGGDFERGRSLFEKVVTNYPRRLDIWNVYADALVKQASDVAGARRLYERMAALRLPYNKARLVFRRFATFEKTHGDAETMANVEELAAKYLQQTPSSQDGEKQRGGDDDNEDDGDGVDNNGGSNKHKTNKTKDHNNKEKKEKKNQPKEKEKEKEKEKSQSDSKVPKHNTRKSSKDV